MTWTEPIRDPNRSARPEVLEGLRQVLLRPCVASVHYGGYAHEPILRLLKEHFGTDFSVFDYWDRWLAGAAFFRESEDGPCPQRPEWLEGVPFYVEGFPRTDLLIWDFGWLWPEAWDWLKRGGRLLPFYVFLVDEAREAAAYPAYDWEHTEYYSLGVLNPDSVKSEAR
jgi:hypothetical protein